MKKKLNKNLFRKVLLVVFCAFVCIEGLRLYIDYNDDVEDYKMLLKQVYIHIPSDTINITQLFESKYESITDQNFLKDMQKIDDNIRRSNCLIVDKDFKAIDLSCYPVDYDFNANIVLSHFSTDDLIMSFDDDDHEVYYKLYDILYNYTQNNDELLKIEVVLNNEKKEVFYSLDKFKYLKVGDEVIVDYNFDNEETTIYDFTYFSDNYVHINYDNNTKTYESELDLKKANALLLKEIVRLREAGDAIYYNNARHIIAGNHIYYFSMDRLGSDGYLIRYEVEYDALTTIKKDLFDSRRTLYVGMIIFGIAVSYVLTKAIDKLNAQE